MNANLEDRYMCTDGSKTFGALRNRENSNGFSLSRMPVLTLCGRVWETRSLSGFRVDLVCKVCFADDKPDRNLKALGEIFGMTLIHEYTHYQPLTSDYVEPYELEGPDREEGRTYRVAEDIDESYGAFATQRLKEEKPRLALVNADNYAYFATEFYWTKRCGKPLPEAEQPPQPNQQGPRQHA